MRSIAAASCINAIGRSNAASSSRLVGDLGGCLQAARHRVEIHALVEAAFPRQLERGRRPERPVEVQMQLRLGHPREKVGRAHDPIVRQSTAPEHT